MMALLRRCLQSVINTSYKLTSREISIFPRLQLKEIYQREEGKTIIVEGKYVPSPREPYLVKPPGDSSEPCALCRLNFDIKHTDVLILSQFVRSDGCMLPRRITGLCKKQQKRVTYMVAMAQKAGLMSLLTPSTSKKDPKLRKQWKKFNMYFDESTIKTRY